MEYVLNNKIFDGKYQWFYFLILDIGDLLGKIWPFPHPSITLVLGDNLTFQNFKINLYKLKNGSTKREFGLILFKEIKRRLEEGINIGNNVIILDL